MRDAYRKVNEINRRVVVRQGDVQAEAVPDDGQGLGAWIRGGRKDLTWTHRSRLLS